MPSVREHTHNTPSGHSTASGRSGHDTCDEAQREVVSFLSNPASYSPKCEKVDKIETHGAVVLLAGRNVYKIKRNVRYPYMDYSTLDKRHQACQAEISINKPHAPQIYRGVVAVTRRPDGHLQIAGDGVPVEWAVHMNRFDQSGLLSTIAKDGKLDQTIVRSVASEIARYHSRSKTIVCTDAAERLGQVVSQIEQAITSGHGGWPERQCAALRRRLRKNFQDVRDLLDRRGSAGFVRRGHGDMHLSNIVMIDGHAVLFDSIEFDEALATTDTLYDLAFIVMDLDAHGYRPQASLLLNRYLIAANHDSDLDTLSALPLFMSLRASIRAMVARQRSELLSDKSKKAALSQAETYFARAVAYLEDVPTKLIAVGGFSGTGKSTLAAALAPFVGRAPGAIHIRSDIERKLMFGVNETDRLPATAYDERPNREVYGRILSKAKRVLATGHSVIVDAVFADKVERDATAEIAAGAGVTFKGLWLTAPRETLHQRVNARQGDASDATQNVVDRQLAKKIDDLDWYEVDASGSPAETLAHARDLLHRSQRG